MASVGVNSIPTLLARGRADMAFHMFYHRHMRALGAPVQMHDDDDQVLTFREWCALNAISPTTGRRILAGGDGPVVTALSAKRIGITRGANRAWQASRARS